MPTQKHKRMPTQKHKNIHPACLLLAALAGLILCFNLATGTLAKRLDAVQVTLSRDTVVRFLATFPEVRTIGLRHGMSKSAELMTNDDPISALLRIAADKKFQDDIDAAVKPHGFQGFGEWFAVSQSVAIAYAKVRSGPGNGKLDKELDKTIEKIKENDILSEKQKRKLIEKLKESAQTLGATDVPPENVQLIRSMKKDIEAVVKKSMN